MKEYIVKVKVVVSRSHSGFNLSAAASAELARRKGVDKIDAWKVDRHDPDLVNIVETMGKDSWGDYSKLEIDEIAFHYYIPMSSGFEQAIPGS